MSERQFNRTVGRPKGRRYTANLHVSITPAQRSKLERVAEKRDLPFAFLVRKMIDDMPDERGT